MTKTRAPFRLAAALAFAASLVTTPAFAQSAVDQVADEAEIIANESFDAIRAIDPTTGGPSPVIDPSLPTPYGAELVSGEEPGATLLAMPPVAGEARVPAARTIPARPAIANSTTSALPAARPDMRPAAPDQAYISETAQVPVIESDDPFVIKSILPIEGSIRYGEWAWDESRAPAKGKLMITVDLDARIISVFRDGHEIGTSVALLGTKKHPTPLGVFPILTKEIDNVSEKYNNAPMPYTLRLTWSGIAIHGSPVVNGYASHGCIGVPDDFAEKLFAIAKRGDKVVITKGNLVGLGHKMY
ncbi:MAG: L,D-transpeptidase family protein [Pseudomonadota bacterium]